MKKIWILSSTALLSFFSTFAQANDYFKLMGTLAGASNNCKIYLIQKSTEDTISVSLIQNNRFTLTGKCDQDYYWLRLDSSCSNIPSNAIWLSPTTMHLEADLNTWPNLTMKGSISQEDYEGAVKIDLKFKQIRREIYKANVENGNTDSSVQIKIKATYQEQSKEMEKYILENLNSTFIPYAIIGYEPTFGRSKMQELYDLLSPDSKNSLYGKKLARILNTGKLEVGSYVGRFSGISPEMKVIEINDILKRNKYILIDFWASWCKPCREENPELKSVYEKFHVKGFEIVSITSDKNVSHWTKAIEDDELPWIHLSDEKMSAEIAKMYNIKALPAYYLVDSTGKVIESDNPLSGTLGRLREGKLEKLLHGLLP